MSLLFFFAKLTMLFMRNQLKTKGWFIMKTLRILWLVIAGVILFPIIAIVSAWWLAVCIRATKRFDGTVGEGIRLWFNYLKEGIRMNADFVQNGF